jgi:hypothetical protein
MNEDNYFINVNKERLHERVTFEQIPEWSKNISQTEQEYNWSCKEISKKEEE